METFADVIDRFSSAEALAAKIGEKGVTVRAWRLRKSIPPRYWPAIESAAKESGIDGINIDALCRIAITESQERQAS